MVALVVTGSLAWRLSGGTLFTVATPSMCPDLCVGTLVLDRPLAGPLEPGAVVSFRPPGTSTVYTHRVARVLRDGALRTEGDATHLLDPWTVPRRRVIGVVVASVAGLGWLWRSTPWVAAVWASTLLFRGWVRPEERGDVDTVGAALAVAVPALVMRPFLRSAVVAWRARGDSVVMTVVNTGLVPVRYRAAGAAATRPVAPGDLRSLHALAGHGAAVSVHVSPALGPLGWAATAFVVLLPLLALAVRALAGRVAGGAAPIGIVRACRGWAPRVATARYRGRP